VIGGAVQTYSWRLSVVWARSRTTGDIATPWVASVPTSLRAAGTEFRQLLVIAPLRCNVVHTAQADLTGVGDWGAASASTILADRLTAACDDALCRWQAGYANGFGRIPVPRSRFDAAMALSFPLDQLTFGSNDAIRKAAAAFEVRWREMATDPAGGLVWPDLKTDLDTIVSAGNSATLAALNPEPWAQGDYLAAGDRSVRMAQVMRWTEYALREVDDNQTAANVPVWAWRRQAQQGMVPEPKVDMAAAWSWEVVQAACQVASQFFAVLDGNVANFAGATAAVFANPVNGHVTLRLHGGATRPVWAVLQVGPGASADAEIAGADMALEAGQAAGPWIAARAVAMANTAAAASVMPPYVWDVERALAAFDRTLAANSPVLQNMTAGQVMLSTEQSGQQITTWLMPDGTERRVASVSAGLDTWAIADVRRPALALPDPKRMRSGMRPHALLQLLGGQAAAERSTASAGLNVTVRPR
jgi:hypothetical protein